ncbi:hypothetical protein Tco_0849327 [Tanacetum coccineum]
MPVMVAFDPASDGSPFYSCLYRDIKKEADLWLERHGEGNQENVLYGVHRRQVKDNKIDRLVQQYEQFTIFEEESIDRGFARFNTVITSLKALDEDLSSLALDELIDNLKVHEVIMEKDSQICKGKRERVKSITLRAKKESSDDETSTSECDDEEYDIRDFKKFFRRKGRFVSNHMKRTSHSEKGMIRKARVIENALDAEIRITSLASVQNLH